MSLRLSLALAVIALAMACSSGDPASHEKQITSKDFEASTGKPWPLTVDSGLLYCRSDYGEVYLQVPGVDHDYLIGGGSGRPHTRRIAEITKPGASTGTLFEEGLALC